MIGCEEMELRHQRKRETEKSTKGHLFVFFLFLFFLAYGISILGNKETERFIYEENPGQIWVERQEIWGKRRIELEEYLVGMVAGTIPFEFEMETLKAQAVILRSHCVSMVEKIDGRKIVKEEDVQNYYLSEKERSLLWKDEEETYSKKIKEAVTSTKGKVLLFQDQMIAPPFFLSGNGKTRDMRDYPAFGEKLGYIKSVECPKDIESENYNYYSEITEQEFIKILEKKLKKRNQKVGKITLFRDSSNYIKTVEIGESQINGEEFRGLFSLPSSCFQIEKINHMIQFKTVGRGHGFGFSQFQANEFAKEGMKMEEILAYFFEDISLEKI